MKIVLSRKGFDSANGGVPSPLLPDGRLVPLPIPATRDQRTYGDIAVNGMPLGPLVEDLTTNRIERTHRCHLDPDLDVASVARRPGWRPAFGQLDAAQSHLARHEIGCGDLFLFFGWFRAVEQIGRRWRYIRGAPDLHAIYGWMQVGEVVCLGNGGKLSKHLSAHTDHPHVQGRDSPSNTLYLASDHLCLPDIQRPGGGLFGIKSDARVLTDTRQSKRSVWRLPAWFHPQHGTVVSYHTKPGRWTLADDECLLGSAGRGQEFVVTLQSPGVARSWLENVFR